MPKAKPWPWHIFWPGFWSGFGRMMAIFSAVLLVVPWFADTSFVSFGSAMGGLFFAVLCSVVYGYSEGDAAVRHWRNTTVD
jgi:hypothetical protein